MFGNRAAAERINYEVYDNNMRKQLYASILEEDRKRLQFTPDYQELSQHKSRLLFVHDDMMQLQPNHKMVEEGSTHGFYPLAYGYTTRRFSFVKKELGLASFPIALLMREVDELPMFIARTHRIRGEVYSITPEQFIKLDTHRQNGVQFQRMKVNINLGFKKLRRHEWIDASAKIRYEYELGKEEMITQEMFMYVAREDYWKDQLESGFFDFKEIDIIKEDRLWLKEYYQYSRVR